MTTSLADIIARMSTWAGSSLRTAPLAGGLTNRNYRVDVNGESFVVRIGGNDPELLGINRRHEYECSVIAAEAGVAPAVVAFFPELGAMVTRFVDGRKIPTHEMRAPGNIRRAARVIRTLHGARAFPAAWSPFRAIEHYAAAARRLACPLPSELDGLLAHAAQIEQALYAHGAPQLVPCHNDLLNENFLDDGSVRVIDYEYSAMGDPYFDLANFSAHHAFEPEHDACLLAAYFGDAHAGRDARLQQMKAVSDLREALWGVVQIRLSQLDFDYAAYAAEWLARYHAQCERAARSVSSAAASDLP